MTAHARDIAAGTRLGNYEVLRKLATGGMAEIYLARVRGAFEFEKLVVLKTILPSVADDPTFVAMFLDEARLAATLHHPHIAQVLDVGEDRGTYFFAMEFVHGEDARSLRRTAKQAGRPLPLAHALAVVHATASALHYAHDKTIVHRDVSPSNILISYDGAVKLVDFGIARASARQTKTRTGTLKGKIPYMSPEQCRGMPCDRRSDLFSRGVVLHELTVGRRPFHGKGNGDFAILEQIVHGAPTKPSEVMMGYPPALEHIIGRLLAREPDDRYPTAEDMLIDLDAFIADANLRVSSIALGKYMHELFGPKILAWEQADSAGVTLGQHVAQTITSESRRSEKLYTPPSAVSGAAISGAAIIDPSGPVRAMPLPAPPVSGPVPAPVPAKVADAAAALTRPRAMDTPSQVSGVSDRQSLLGPAPVVTIAPRRIGAGLIVAALLIGGGGVAVGVYLGRGSHESPPAAAPATTAPTPTPAAAPTETTATAPATETAPATGTETETGTETGTGTGTETETGTGTETETPAAHVVVKPPDTPASPKAKPKSKRTRSSKPKEDPSWDHDSPFLPH